MGQVSIENERVCFLTRFTKYITSEIYCQFAKNNMIFEEISDHVVWLDLTCLIIMQLSSKARVIPRYKEAVFEAH